ncbi:MAG: tRNA pseudouridine(13) synthase TruD, partial [Deltaproteobacteria bacterium]|nr:tRNA pseudouridine(13) synthase TruD [Deltaproteobacteria bacterium]
ETLGVDGRDAGFAGMKDRHAITTQTASFPFPADREVTAAVDAIALPGIEILGAARHEQKLRTGHLSGNRFELILRDLDPGAMEAMGPQLETLRRQGLPNAFGPQRFGRDGDNPERALRWIAGDARPPRSKREQRLLFSAWQSLLFNQVLEQRVQAGTWDHVLPGDLAKKHDTGGLFVVPPEGPELDDARERASANQLSATGPMFGAKMRWPEGVVATQERAVLEASLGEPDRLKPLKRYGKGTRRPLRLQVRELEWRLEADKSRAWLTFVLAKGGYATSVLGHICHPVDPHTRPTGGDEQG